MRPRGSWSMIAKLAKVRARLVSGLSSGTTRVRTTFSRVGTSEVTETLIATWCFEYLRLRKVGGFNAIEMVAISALMLAFRTIISEASRRKYGGKGKSIVVSDRYSQMGDASRQRDLFGAERQRARVVRRT